MDDQVNGFLKYLSIEKDSSLYTITKYKADLNRLQTYLTKYLYVKEPCEIQVTHLRRYLEYIKISKNLSSSTIANKIAVLKSFFKYLYEQGDLDKNPSSLLRMPKRRRKIPKFLNDIELAKLLSSPDRIKNKKAWDLVLRDKLILNLLAFSGLRKSELLNLDWDDINLGARYLIVRNGKNRTDRIIPLHEGVFTLLEKYLSERLPLKCNALIIGMQGRRLGKNGIEVVFKKYIKLSGLSSKGYSIHTLRHYVECYIMVSEEVFA